MIYRKNCSKDNKILLNVRIEESAQIVFAKTDRLMSENFIQKFSRISEKHVEKLIEIELIEISNRDSTVIADASIKFRIIITILQKTDFFAQKRWFHAARSASMKRNEFEIISISIDSAIQNLKQNDAMNTNDFMKFDIDSQNAKTDTDNWKIQENILCYKNKWYISFDFLKKEFLKRNHDDSNANHFEFKRILKIIHRKYYWFRMSVNIKKYVDICSNCVKTKTFRHKFYDLLQFFSVSKEFKQEWILNFITNLSSSVRRKTNYDSIFVMMNRYFKFARYIVARKNWNAKNLAKIMIEQIFSIFEMFTNIISNRNSLFISNWLMNSFIRRCSIEYVDLMRVYLLLFTYRKTLYRKKTHIFCFLSNAFRSSLETLSTSIQCRFLSAVHWNFDMFFYWSLIEWRCSWATVNWINILNFITHLVSFFSSAVVLMRFR